MKSSKSLACAPGATKEQRKGNAAPLPFACVNRARVPQRSLPFGVWSAAYRLVWPKENHVICLVLASRKEGAKLNEQYRNASYTPDVLAFPLSPTLSDIVIVPARARERAREFNLSFPDILSYLFIHAALHIRGYAHGAAMDAAERRLLQRLNVPLPAHLRKKSG